MAQSRTRRLTDAQGRAVGMAPRAEVIRWITEGAHEDQTLADVISDASLLTGAPDEAIGGLVERMVERDVGRVPIVDAGGRLVGLVTRKDLLRVHARQRSLEVERQATPLWVKT
jgi:CBS domain-containing protein